MYKNRAFFLVVASFVLTQFVTGQYNTNSPYTRFGYGDISDANSGEQKAMGGVALGARSNRSINTVNPASYSSVDSMTFMFDLGMSGLISRFSSAAGNTHKFTANLDYVSMQFPLMKNVGFSAGLQPYSFVGYNYNKASNYITNTNIGDFDTLSYRTNYMGYGGLSQVYAGISAKFLNHVSLGANAYYMFGTIYNERSFTAYDSTYQKNMIDVRSFRFRYGAQFYNTFAQKHDVTLGLIYEPKKRLNGSFMQVTHDVLGNDTTPSLANDSLFEVPETYGFGLYYTYDKHLSFGLDYTLQKWGEAKYRGEYDLNDRSKVALGVEYIPNPRSRKFLQRVTYRGGLNLSDPYYKVNNNVNPPKNFGITVGAGMPFYNRYTNATTMVNAAFEYGKIGSSDLLREDYFRFTVNVTFGEHWFMKTKL